MKTKLYAFMMAAIVAVAFNFISCNNEKDEPKGPVINPSGTVDPSQSVEAEDITVAQAIEIANALEPKAKTKKNYRVTVTLTKVFTAADKVAQYGNINIEVKDETGTISCYYTNNIGNTKFTSADQIPAIGSKIVIVGPLKKYEKDGNTSPEFENAWIEKVIENGSGENPSVDPGEVEDVTVAQAIEIANALEPKGKTTKNYRVTVTLTKVFTASDKVAQYGNINCELQDETGTIGSYYMNNVGNVKFTSADQVPPIGSKLVVVGPLKLYAGKDGNTPEFENAWIEKIVEEGSGETSTDPSVDPGEVENVTVAQAIEIANALEPKGKTTKNYRVTVTLTKVFTASDKVAQYGNINCELQDETGTIGSYYMNNVGNVKFTSADQVPPIGSKLVVVGPLKLYAGQDSNTPEFENAWIEEILELGSGETSEDPSVEPQPISDENIIENYSIEESSFISKDDQSKITSATVTFADGVATIAGSTSSGNMRLGAPLVTLPAGNYILSASVKAESGEAKAKIGYAVAKSDNSGYDYKYINQPITLAAGADYVEIQYEFTLAAETEIAPVVSNHGKTGNAILVNRLVLAKK